MKFQITDKQQKPQDNDFYKQYFKLVAIRFTEFDNIKTAKKYFKQNIRKVSVVVDSSRVWTLDDDDVVVQVVELSRIPDKLIEVEVDKMALIFSVERFRLKGEDLVKLQTYESEMI